MISDVEKCKENKWGPGTFLEGDEGYGPTVIQILYVGEDTILAKSVMQNGESIQGREDQWTLSCRDWKSVDLEEITIYSMPTIEDLRSKQEFTYYWSRKPGVFVNRDTGKRIEFTSTLDPGPVFTGNPREWYETLTETIISAHHETLKPQSPTTTESKSKSRVYASPDILTMIECSALYRPELHPPSVDLWGTLWSAATASTQRSHIEVYRSEEVDRNEVFFVSDEGRVARIEVLDLNVIESKKNEPT